MYKKCSKCGESKLEAEFNKDKKSPDGLFYYCRDCQKKANAEYRKKKPEKVKQAVKNWYQANSEAEKRRQKKIYREKNKILYIRNINPNTKPKLKAIAKAHGFSTINSFLDYYAEKEFENIPEKFKEGVSLQDSP